MVYKKGTIVFTRRTIFEDIGQDDNRSGHPGMIPITSDDVTGDVYYLMLTSNMLKKEAFPDKYYDLTDCWEMIPLSKPSLINLETIYKGHDFGSKLGGLPPYVRKDVIRELKRYQEGNPCENYLEIKAKL